MISSPYGGDRPGSVLHAHIIAKLFKSPSMNDIDGLKPENNTPVGVDFKYDPADIHALQLKFKVGTNEYVEWNFARELLIDGLKRMVGLGDVQIYPIGENVHLDLNSPSGQARFVFSMPALKVFVTRMVTSKPLSEEMTDKQLDEVILQILQESE